MKAILTAALAASALVTAAPVMAQPYGPPAMGGMRAGATGWDIDRRIGWLQERVTRGIADGSLDRREARRVQFQLDSIRRDQSRMRAMHGGRLWDRDRLALQSRLDRVSDSIRWARSNPDFRRPW